MWEAGMHPSFLFLDEYVACRSLLPKKPARDDGYCLATFDDLIKRIVTMGAPAGCYVIISIARASVDEGGGRSGRALAGALVLEINRLRARLAGARITKSVSVAGQAEIKVPAGFAAQIDIEILLITGRPHQVAAPGAAKLGDVRGQLGLGAILRHDGLGRGPGVLVRTLGGTGSG